MKMFILNRPNPVSLSVDLFVSHIYVTQILLNMTLRPLDVYKREQHLLIVNQENLQIPNSNDCNYTMISLVNRFYTQTSRPDHKANHLLEQRHEYS